MKWMTRAGIALALVAGLGALSWLLFPRPISETLFRILVARQNLTAGNAQEGLHVYLCGTGSPLPDPTRSGPCLGIVAGGRAFVIDPGEGSARRLTNMGFPFGSVEAVLITHLHTDHIDGLGGVLLQAWIVGGRDRPLPIYGPKGIARVIAGVNEMFAIDATYRTAHHGPSVANPDGYGAAPIPIELSEDQITQVVQNDNLSISAVPVSHRPVDPALALRFDHAGRAVSFSGDTNYDPRFVDLSRGVDLMIHDAMQHRIVETMENRVNTLAPDTVVGRILHDITDYHATPEDAARAAQDADAGALVLTHIAPPLPSRLTYPAFLGGAPDLFDGPVTVGEDGMMFSFAPEG